MAQIIGVDIGGTKIAFGLVDTETGNVFNIEKIPTPRTKEEILRKLQQICSKKPCGIGIPGQVKAGKIIFTPNLPLSGISINELPFARSLINDANAFLLGELQNLSTTPKIAIAFTLGTGIGGAIAINGKILEGPHGTTGEFGHVTILPNGPICGCGNRGCAEAVASPKSIERWAEEELKNGAQTTLADTSFKKLLELYPQDSLAIRAIIRFSEMLGTLVASMANAIDPEVIIFGGSAVKSWNTWAPLARSVFERRVLPSLKNKVRWIKSNNPEESAIRGAALSAVLDWSL